jgi:hypothetical protein
LLARKDLRHSVMVRARRRTLYAMTVTKAMTRFCGATTRSGGACARPAGWGTDHAGHGPCKLHAGSTPTVRRRYAQEEAIEHARVALDEIPEIDPLDAALVNVRIAHAVVAFHRAKIASLETVGSEDIGALEAAVVMSQRVVDMALRAGVAERLVDAAERVGEQIALVCEEGLAALTSAGVQLSNTHRVVYAEAIAAGLRQLESEPLDP